MITYPKDDPMYANDLSFMTDEDWTKLNEARKTKESAKCLPSLDRQLDRHNTP